MPLSGLPVTILKKHPASIPLFVCVGAGLSCATGSLFRAATRNPDVAWINKRGELSNTRLPDNNQYKFYPINRDYKNLKFPDERPKI